LARRFRNIFWKSRILNKPILSICIPAYENEKSLKQALTSTLGLDNAKIEILISDDSSTNSLQNVALDFRHLYPTLNLTYHHQPINLGVAYNKKWLLENAKGALILFLEHDDELIHTEMIKSALNLYESNEKIKLFLSNAYISENGKKRIMQQNLPKTYGNYRNISNHYFIKKFLLTSRIRSVSLNWSSVIFEKEAALKAGAFSDLYMMTKCESTLFSSYHNEENMIFILLLANRYELMYTSTPTSIRNLLPRSFSVLNSEINKDSMINPEYIFLLKIISSVDSYYRKILIIKRLIWIGIPMRNDHIFHSNFLDKRIQRIILYTSLFTGKIYNPLTEPFRSKMIRCYRFLLKLIHNLNKVN